MKDTVNDTSAQDVPESASFGCAVVTNRFALGQLLDDEVDPFDIIREAQAEKQKKKKKDEVKKPANVTGKPVKKESQKDRRVPVSGEGDNSQQTKSLQGKVKRGLNCMLTLEINFSQHNSKQIQVCI